MIGVYVRVSTAGQKTDGQKQDIERWLKGNGNKSAKWYIDKATGSNLKRVVSTSQQIDFNGSLGKMLAAVLLGIAEMEQELRRERQAVGIKAAKARGVYFGRQAGTTKAQPQRARQLQSQGLTAAEIATSMGVSLRTVFRYLKISQSITRPRHGRRQRDRILAEPERRTLGL